jgi:ADP-heptose:LPS heptosyltransferase
VFPFPSHAIRRYPSHLLARVITEIAGKHDLPVVIIGGAADTADADHLLGLLDIRQEKISLAGKLTLEESVLCIARAAALLGVESAGAHVAIAAGVPSVVILGGGHHGQFGPWGPESKTCWVSHKMDCYGCSWNCTQPGPLCIERISPASIIEAFGRVFPNRNNNRVS